ncbi:MAG: hypothetical protein MZV70_69845 [Desulfobacterales bacterium]|nr:hypothetical protein [Desulfobacterales bacterium]
MLARNIALIGTATGLGVTAHKLKPDVDSFKKVGSRQQIRLQIKKYETMNGIIRFYNEKEPEKQYQLFEKPERNKLIKDYISKQQLPILKDMGKKTASIAAKTGIATVGAICAVKIIEAIAKK